MTAFEAGRKGQSIRSDCWVRFTPESSGRLRVEAKSKVESMYGERLRQDAREACRVLRIESGLLEIEDQGALPFVLLARIEAAIRRAAAPTSGQGGTVAPGGANGGELRALPPVSPGARRPAVRERFRRSRLYLPGNEPKFMLNAGLHRPDGIILDLEDSVAPGEKDAARILSRNALRVLDFGEAERMVRINPLPLGLDDLEELMPQNLHVVLIPKCESGEQVRQVADRVRQIQARADGRAGPLWVHPEGSNRPTPVMLMPIVESALGVLRAYEIATACPEVVALTIGLEDYTADLGVQRTAEGRESFFARSMVVQAARAASVQAIDSVYSDVGDLEGLFASVREAKELGFEGKGCIHPRQIEAIHRGFAPAAEEREKAERIVQAFREAEARGEAVVALGSKMIDPPVVKRALRTVRLAEAYERETRS